MSNTLQTTINWALPFVQYSPLNAGSNNEPALSIANMVINTILSAPLTWSWNRAEDSSTPTIAGTQDYTILLTNFGFLEKVSLTDSNNNIYEVKDIYNNLPLTKTTTAVSGRARPNAVSVISSVPGTSVTIRFMAVPDSIYTINLTYQKAPVMMTTLSSTWSSIPDYYSDIYNCLFLSESLAVTDDARAQIYRQRGVASFLAKADGLTDMQRNAFLQQWLNYERAGQSVTLKLQQGTQARSI